MNPGQRVLIFLNLVASEYALRGSLHGQNVSVVDLHPTTTTTVVTCPLHIVLGLTEALSLLFRWGTNQDKELYLALGVKRLHLA